MDPNKQTLNEILQLSRDTNKILHGMRRSSFAWGVVKVIAYLFLFAAPIWFYVTYVSGTVDRLINTVNQVQGATKQTQTKFNGFEDTVKSIQALFNASSSANTAPTDTPPASTPGQ